LRSRGVRRRRAAQFRAWEQHQADSWSGDVCAPPEIDVSELEAMKARALDFRVDLRRDIRVKDAAVG
jgi:hypothetical protein